VVDRFQEMETEEELFTATQAGDMQALVALLNDGASTETTMVVQLQKRLVKVTPLYLAVRYNQPAAAQLLLQRGADPNHTSSEGHSPLMGAAIIGDERLEMVHTLHRGGADLDCAAPADGFTAFHLACLNGHRSAAVAEALVALGCDTDVQTAQGASGAEIAAQQGHMALHATLLRVCRSHRLRSSPQPVPLPLPAPTPAPAPMPVPLPVPLSVAASPDALSVPSLPLRDR
jgi:ankyrin repeat protein